MHGRAPGAHQMANFTCWAVQVVNARQIVWNAPHKPVADEAPVAAAAAPAEEAAENGAKPDKEEEAKPRASGTADEAMAARAKRCNPRRPKATLPAVYLCKLYCRYQGARQHAWGAAVAEMDCCRGLLWFT